MSDFPSKEDYLKAVQHPEAFRSGELRRAEFVLHPVWRIPSPASGTSAVVFKAVLDGEEQALRFPTRAGACHRDRYTALRDHFLGQGLTDCVAMSHWVDDAITVNGRTWPMIRMTWVNGRTLNRHVEDLVEAGDTGALTTLAGTWRDLVLRLQAAEFAHGDLQHGNVLVDGAGVPRLVDFDCSWIGRFAGQAPPSETGHRNYQPPGRPWGPRMDTFPGLVIYLSLLALSRNPTPWRSLHVGDNLLFQRDDFQPPFRTPTWTHLAALRDPEVDHLADRLREQCHPGSPIPDLHELLTGTTTRPWWERLDQQPTSTSTPPPPRGKRRQPEPPPLLKKRVPVGRRVSRVLGATLAGLFTCGIFTAMSQELGAPPATGMLAGLAMGVLLATAVLVRS